MEQAESLSRRWADRLDDFELPCPLCRGELIFQGVRYDRLYEFAEGEPGVVHPLDVLPITFICNRCGYTAEFDAELFNPAYLARLQGAKPERLARLSVRDYRVLVPLRGDEHSTALLDLATALAGVRHGDVIVFQISQNETLYDLLQEKLQQYRPAIGDPAPFRLVRQPPGSTQDTLHGILAGQGCNLMLVGAHGWDRGQKAGIGTFIDAVLKENLCEVAVVHDRGLKRVDRVLLATAGGPNAKAAAPLALSLAQAFDAELHLLYVARPDLPDSEEIGQARLAETIGGLGEGIKVKLVKHVVFDRNPVQAIINESANYDLLLLGASPTNWRGQIQLSSLAAKAARNSDTTALVVLARDEQPRSWFERLFG